MIIEMSEREAEVVLKLMSLGLANNPEENKETKSKMVELALSATTSILEAHTPPEPLKITLNDLFLIKSAANAEYQRLPINLHISNKAVESSDLVHIALANSFIMWLNGKHVLKKLAGFDYTDLSAEYESIEE